MFHLASKTVLACTIAPFIIAFIQSKFLFHEILFSTPRTHQDAIASKSSQYRNISSPQCAQSMPKAKRKVLLVGFRPKQEFPWISEEYHFSNNLISHLKMMNFDITYADEREFLARKGSISIANFHRVFYIPKSVHDIPKVLLDSCKVRYFLGGTKAITLEEWHILSRLHEKQLLSPYTRDGMTYISYQPFLNEPIEFRHREKDRSGIIFLSSRIDEEQILVLKELQKEDIDVDVLYTKEKSKDSEGSLLRSLSNASFVLTYDDEVSTALVKMTLKVGTSIIAVHGSKNKIFEQTREPYVFKVEPKQKESIVKAVKESLDYSFHAFSLYGDANFYDLTCAILEDDSVCSCQDARSTGVVVDCRSSMYMKKSKVYKL
ncbi:predicted protein [Chaetoceros tenuissimus]|uniref:Uncharacterized protein n=1 Tax=Chaetoceros tenuissimus TaxID=426638 RepID=A0AAD3H9K2_9STRA|nr:predicted protein [Chaetoceros tenuissimus]